MPAEAALYEQLEKFIRLFFAPSALIPTDFFDFRTAFSAAGATCLGVGVEERRNLVEAIRIALKAPALWQAIPQAGALFLLVETGDFIRLSLADVEEMSGALAILPGHWTFSYGLTAPQKELRDEAMRVTIFATNGPSPLVKRGF